MFEMIKRLKMKIMIKMLEIMEGEKEDGNDEIGFNDGNNENGDSREKS